MTRHIAMVFLYYGSRCRSQEIAADSLLDRLASIASHGKVTMIIARPYGAYGKDDVTWRWTR